MAKRNNDTPPNKILTYKDNADYFNNTAVYHNDSAYNEQIKQKIYSGKWGYNPTTGTLTKLGIDKQTKVDPKIQKWATQSKDELSNQWVKEHEKQQKDKVAVQVPKEAGWNHLGEEYAGKTLYMSQTEAEQFNKDMVKFNMEQVQKHPLWQLPGMVSGATMLPFSAAARTAGSYVPKLVQGTKAALNTTFNTPIANIPQLTVGNLTNAYFASRVPEGISKVSNDPNLENVSNLGLDLLGVSGMLGGVNRALRSTTSAVKPYLKTIPQSVKNVVKGEAKFKDLFKREDLSRFESKGGLAALEERLKTGTADATDGQWYASLQSNPEALNYARQYGDEVMGSVMQGTKASASQYKLENLAKKLKDPTLNLAEKARIEEALSRTIPSKQDVINNSSFKNYYDQQPKALQTEIDNALSNPEGYWKTDAYKNNIDLQKALSNKEFYNPNEYLLPKSATSNLFTPTNVNKMEAFMAPLINPAIISEEAIAGHRAMLDRSLIKTSEKAVKVKDAKETLSLDQEQKAYGGPINTSGPRASKESVEKPVDEDAMNAMMKARLAYAQMHGNPAAQRMVSPTDQSYDFGDGYIGTHYMSSMDNYAVPQIQNENNQLQLGNYGPRSNEAMRFNNNADAEYFAAENYKRISPAFQKAYGGSINNNNMMNRNQYADGGQLTQFNEGGTHEENPLGGIPQGQGPGGQPNLVEEGETKLDSANYIFSDRLKLDKEVAEDLNIEKKYIGKTFSDISKKLSTSDSFREGDTIEDSNSKRNLDNLMNAQEEFKKRDLAKDLMMMQEKHPEFMAQMTQPQAQEPQQPSQEEMMAQQQMQQQGQPPMDPSMMQQQGGVPPMPQMQAYGGNMYAEGGPLGGPGDKDKKKKGETETTKGKYDDWNWGKSDPVARPITQDYQKTKTYQEGTAMTRNALDYEHNNNLMFNAESESWSPYNNKTDAAWQNTAGFDNFVVDENASKTAGQRKSARSPFTIYDKDGGANRVGYYPAEVLQTRRYSNVVVPPQPADGFAGGGYLQPNMFQGGGDLEVDGQNQMYRGRVDETNASEALTEKTNADAVEMVGSIPVVGGIIQAGIGVGDMIGDPIKQSAEKKNADGTFQNKTQAEAGYGVASFFDPFRTNQDMLNDPDSTDGQKAIAVAGTFLPGIGAFNSKAYAEKEERKAKRELGDFGNSEEQIAASQEALKNTDYAARGGYLKTRSYAPGGYLGVDPEDEVGFTPNNSWSQIQNQVQNPGEQPIQYIANENMGGKGTPMVDKDGNTFGKADLNQGQTNFDTKQTIGDLMTYAPVAYNFMQGAFGKADKKDLNDYYKRVEAYKLNIDPELRSIEQTAAASQNALKNALPGPAGYALMAKNSQIRNEALSQAHNRKQMFDINQKQQSERENNLNKIDARKYVTDYNAQSEAALRGYTQEAYKQMGDIGTSNTKNKFDKKTNEIMSPDFSANYITYGEQFQNWLKAQNEEKEAKTKTTKTKSV